MASTAVLSVLLRVSRPNCMPAPAAIRPSASEAALMRLTESYLALGIPEEAKKAAAVLGANYPQTQWYQRAYELMQKHPA